jgi:hypothetical protein
VCALDRNYHSVDLRAYHRVTYARVYRVCEIYGR